MRRISYRTAANAFIFTALWLLIGALTLWSPVPGALGIAGGMFTAWLLLFFAALALAGALLTMAALNAAFPPSAASPPRRTAGARRTAHGGETLWAPTRPASGGARRDR